MDAARHRQVKELFEEACLEARSERFAFLARACGDDDALRREVESLLAFYEEPAPIEAGAPRLPRTDGRGARFRRGSILAGRYRIERRLGAGGMGAVYAAWDALMREEVALKILHHSDSVQRNRLIEEVRLARQVSHPGVCRVYDLSEDAGVVFFSMELIEGEDLAHRLARSGPLPSDEVAHLGTKLAEALGAAHDAGVLHRDLKPSNVLIGRDGAVRITDFGIAVRRGYGLPADEEARRLGTPSYMAPEECTPGGIATQQSDLYSLGLLLYELLTGTVPFDAPDLETLLELQRSSAPTPPSRILSERVDMALEVVVMRLLEKDPSRRPESARAVVAALAAARQASDVSKVSGSVERRKVVTLSCRLLPAPGEPDPRWTEWIRTFQARCAAACRLRGGKVGAHLTDGLLEHFGLPRAGEQDAERAVEAGLEIVAGLTARPLVAPGAPRPAAILAADALPATLRAGRVTLPDVQARLLSEAATSNGGGEDRLIVSPALVDLLRNAFSTIEIQNGGGVSWHRVTRARQRLGLADIGSLARFTGRELELAQLEQWWRDAVSGRGQVVLVSGEAGVGKSRVVHELWRRVRDQGLGFEARCSSVHSDTPLYPFVSMVGQIAALAPDDDDGARRLKLRRALTVLGERADGLLPLFLSWLSGTAGADEPGAAGPTARTDQRAAIAGLTECVLALAESRPVLLVCEDVHWADPSTLEAIDQLVELVPAIRVMLVLTLRDELAPPWRGTGVNRLALQPLRAEEARAMVAALPDPVLGDVDALIDRADGNPLFLEELAKHWSDRGAPAASVVPRSLQDLLAARLDRVGPAKALAKAAAVCGRSSSYAMLAAVAGEPPESTVLQTELARLLDEEILQQQGLGQRASFRFRHALLQNAAHDSLAARERRVLHERAARALLELEPASCALHPQGVATHWTEAGRHPEAFQWWRRAGLRALDRSAYAEAEHLFDRALRSLRRTPITPERRRRELDLRLDLTSLEMGRHGPASAPAARHAGIAAKLCAGLPLDDEVARALMLSARVRFARGEMQRTLRMLEPLRAFADRIQNPYLRASILTQASNLLTSLGRVDESDRFQTRAIEAYGQATERPAGVLTTDPLAHLMITRASNEWLRGHARESTRWIDDAIAHADRLGHPFSRAMVLVLAASLSLRRRDWSRFRALVDDATRSAAAVGAYWLIDMSNVMAPLADGSLDPAARAERLRAALAVPPGTRLYRSVPMSELADLLASLGHEDEAQRVMDEATAEARHWDIGLLPEILRRRGELAARLGRLEEAEVELRRGVRAARHLGVHGLELRCVLSLARLLEETGRRAAARRALESLLSRLPADVDAPERADAVRTLQALGGSPETDRAPEEAAHA